MKEMYNKTESIKSKKKKCVEKKEERMLKRRKKHPGKSFLEGGSLA